jgi:hypothetical protein
MITKRAEDYIRENSSEFGLVMQVADLLDIYSVDDSFDWKGQDNVFVVGAPARYKYIKKKNKGKQIPPHLELAVLERKAEELIQSQSEPSEPDQIVEGLTTTDLLEEDNTSQRKEIVGGSTRFDEDLFDIDADVDVGATEDTTVPSPPPNSSKEDAESDEKIEQQDFTTISDRPFVPNRVTVSYIERNTPARVTDYLFHNSSSLTGAELRGVVDAYFYR